MPQKAQDNVPTIATTLPGLGWHTLGTTVLQNSGPMVSWAAVGGQRQNA